MRPARWPLALLLCCLLLAAACKPSLPKPAAEAYQRLGSALTTAGLLPYPSKDEVPAAVKKALSATGELTYTGNTNGGRNIWQASPYFSVVTTQDGTVVGYVLDAKLWPVEDNGDIAAAVRAIGQLNWFQQRPERLKSNTGEKTGAFHFTYSAKGQSWQFTPRFDATTEACTAIFVGQRG